MLPYPPQEAKNERLWFKTNLKLGKLWFDREEYTRLQKILKVRGEQRRGGRRAASAVDVTFGSLAVASAGSISTSIPSGAARTSSG